MKKLPFKSSSQKTLGIELEYQIVDPITYDLISRAKDLIRIIEESPFKNRIKPEITQSMIEINSSVHHSAESLSDELTELQDFLQKKAQQLGILFSGGGTHPFQKWSLRKIFPTKRFKQLSHQFRYLSKRSTVFGQHVHVGCRNADEALYLTHALGRYVPQFIAIAASSPFLEGTDTGFQCVRLNTFNSFPSSGVIPWLINWSDFSDYFYKMKKLGVLKTMKDVYWDVRPKPEFGTVEVRVCDTPLTMEGAVMIAAYIHAVSSYLLHKKDMPIDKDYYYLYNYNRFQACRYGFEGKFINPINLLETTIQEDILATLEVSKSFCESKKALKCLAHLKHNVLHNINGAYILKENYKKSDSLIQVVKEQCNLWSER